MTPIQLLRQIRICLAIVIAGLLLSGITAFALETELTAIVSALETGPLQPVAEATRLLPWLELVAEALCETNASYPFLAYGTDWLAFAHIVIAIAFIGPWRDPVRNRWVITFGLIACAGVIPLALIAGPIRHIPFPWRLIDCSFGILGIIPLWICHHLIQQWERIAS